ncbi:alginate export family protein [Thalassotalea sp. PLHSN55]|uniref:alginate export family protein n=1 Tax=Thalassotalea sp. PLHSN55 TaxID=3435888 RepID=UPI003F832CD2
MKFNKTTLALLLAGTASFSQLSYAEASLADALSASTVKTDMNLRYESVSQDNALKDADALTLRTRVTLATGDYNNLSAVIEFEDSRQVLGMDSYNDTVGNNGDHSVIADPETTELDQAFVQYKADGVTAKLGRQVITFDGHRFVGHVGWRQDRQTFDGATFAYAADDLTLNYGYITQRNRIFAEAKDLDSKDHLLNASYKTSVGKLTAYGYLLEVDNGISNGLDTYGASFTGATKLDSTKISYQLEYATQDADSADMSYSADYMLAEIGAGFSGVTAKLGYEVLGSDDGMYGFSTPLATLHKFNGWSDQFLSTPKEGLADLYVSLSGKALSGKWAVTYHDFSADDASATVDDLGSEINALYARPFNKMLSGGIKFAAYSAGDAGAGKVDTDKVWVWLTAKF